MRAVSPAAGAWVVVFRLAGREYAVGVADVVEVLRMAALRPVPGAAAWVRGVLNYRGRVIRVVDGRARLGLPAVDPAGSASIVVVDAGGRVVGVVVDEAVGVAALPEDAARPGAELAGGSSAVSAVVRRGEDVVLVLDCARLCAEPSDGGPAGAGPGVPLAEGAGAAALAGRELVGGVWAP